MIKVATTLFLLCFFFSSSRTLKTTGSFLESEK
uniref:Uncharacterized protein n=1 Tax=Rhizophora mucronata TaxID=61149 RepID=A0A2P2QVG8_RHIMU